MPHARVMLRRACFYAALLFLPAAAVHAQPLVYVSIETNLAGAYAYADTLPLGPVTAALIAVPPSTSELRLVAPQKDSWTIEPVAQALSAQPGDTLTVAMRFPHYYRIESVPFGASVYLETAGERWLLGETPVLFKSAATPQGMFAVERAGFVTERLKPGKEVWQQMTVALSPSKDGERTTAEVDWRPPRKQRRWIDYAAAGTAVAAGAFAIHYKFKADRMYDQYLDTTDPSIRSQINSYDRRSAVALGVMQAGVGVFAIRLALRR